MNSNDIIQFHTVNVRYLSDKLKKDIEGNISSLIPGFFHINDIESGAIKYMEKQGVSKFDITINEIKELGTAFLDHYIHKDDIENIKVLIDDFISKEEFTNPLNCLSYIQRMRYTKSSTDYELILTTAKVNVATAELFCISTPFHVFKELSQKVTKSYEEHEYVKSMLKASKTLTKREKTIIPMMSEGLRTKEIADLLFLSPFTVENHKKNIKRKLSVKTPQQLLKFASTFGLLKY